MFYTLSKILCYLVYPMSAIVLILLTAWAVRNWSPAWSWRLFWIAFAGLYIFSTEPVSELLLLPLEGPFENCAVPEKAKAIAVLGGVADLQRSTVERVELAASADRLIQAALLAQDWPDTLVILSAAEEAPLLKPLAIRLGIPEQNLRIEDKARNTRENAVEIKRILDREGISDFIVITSARHMPRGLACFRKLGLEPTPYAVDFRGHFGDFDYQSFIPQIGAMEHSTTAIKEYVGLLMYRIAGYI